MALQIRPGIWGCSYCQKTYTNATEADACRETHELIYVPLTKTDLNRLLNFIWSKNEKYLTKSLMDTLSKYLRGN